MAKMCNCKRGFIIPGRCCCIECDRDRKYDEYYTDVNVPRQGNQNTEPMRPDDKVWKPPVKDDKS